MKGPASEYESFDRALLVASAVIRQADKENPSTPKPNHLGPRPGLPSRAGFSFFLAPLSLAGSRMRCLVDRGTLRKPRLRITAMEFTRSRSWRGLRYRQIAGSWAVRGTPRAVDSGAGRAGSG